jgi:MarR family 2-MHQ and catechol resistance regulon transcriptional repressor
MPTRYRGSAEQVLALDTFIKLTRAVESFSARLARHSSIGDLTPSQFGVLESLHHLGPLKQGDICTKLLRSAGNITLVVDNLEKRGLVRRERDREDRRAVIVSLTDAGEELIAGLFPRHVAAIVQEMSALTANEQEALGCLCRKLGKRDEAIGRQHESQG